MNNKFIYSSLNKSDSRLLYWISISAVLIITFFCRDFIELLFCLIGFIILFTILSYITKTIILTEQTIIIQSIFGKDNVKDIIQCKCLTNSVFLTNTMKIEFLDGNWYLFKGKSSDEIVRMLTDTININKKK